jgi:hypothetical protein
VGAPGTVCQPPASFSSERASVSSATIRALTTTSRDNVTLMVAIGTGSSFPPARRGKSRTQSQRRDHASPCPIPAQTAVPAAIPLVISRRKVSSAGLRMPLLVAAPLPHVTECTQTVPLTALLPMVLLAIPMHKTRTTTASATRAFARTSTPSSVLPNTVRFHRAQSRGLSVSSRAWAPPIGACTRTERANPTATIPESRQRLPQTEIGAGPCIGLVDPGALASWRR